MCSPIRTSSNIAYMSALNTSPPSNLINYLIKPHSGLLDAKISFCLLNVDKSTNDKWLKAQHQFTANTRW